METVRYSFINISMKLSLFIKNHFHQKPLSSKTTFIKNRFHQKPLSSETTFIRNHIHQKPHSSETTFIRNHIHQKPHSSETTFGWTMAALVPARRLHLGRCVLMSKGSGYQCCQGSDAKWHASLPRETLCRILYDALGRH